MGYKLVWRRGIYTLRAHTDNPLDIQVMREDARGFDAVDYPCFYYWKGTSGWDNPGAFSDRTISAVDAYLRKTYKAQRFEGRIKDVLALHGHAGVARAIVHGDEIRQPIAIKFYRRLGERDLVLIDQAIGRGD